MFVWLVAYLLLNVSRIRELSEDLEEKIFNKESLVGIFNSCYKLYWKQLLGLVQLTNRDFLRHQMSRKFSKLEKKRNCL